MKKITSETERKLLSVIEKTAALVADGEHPNDAIVKIASETELRPGEVSVVVHAFNTGRTTRQRQDGSDPFTKSAEFELADTATILDRLYPENVKTASAVVEDTAVSPQYRYSPRPMLERRAIREKQSNVVNWREVDGQQITAPAAYPSDPTTAIKKASSHVDRKRRELEEARRKQANAFDELGRTFNDLTTYFRRPDAHPMPVVKEAVILMHGGKGEQIFDQLVVVTPSLTKMANHRIGSSLFGVVGQEKFATTVEDLDCTQEPFPLVAKMISQISEYQEKRANFQALEAAFVKEASETLLPFAVPAVSPSILDGSYDLREKEAGWDPIKPLATVHLVNNTLRGVADSLKGPDETSEVNKTLAALQDPGHEARLRNINTQAMLQDLMLNDEVISGYDPNEVAGAFNDIVQISPSVADQRMLIQSLLRKKLQQGQLDTFEQDQLLGFEDKLRKQFVPMSGSGNGVL